MSLFTGLFFASLLLLAVVSYELIRAWQVAEDEADRKLTELERQYQELLANRVRHAGRAAGCEAVPIPVQDQVINDCLIGEADQAPASPDPRHRLVG